MQTQDLVNELLDGRDELMLRTRAWNFCIKQNSTEAQVYDQKTWEFVRSMPYSETKTEEALFLRGALWRELAERNWDQSIDNREKTGEWPLPAKMPYKQVLDAIAQKIRNSPSMEIAAEFDRQEREDKLTEERLSKQHAIARCVHLAVKFHKECAKHCKVKPLVLTIDDVEYFLSENAVYKLSDQTPVVEFFPEQPLVDPDGLTDRVKSQLLCHIWKMGRYLENRAEYLTALYKQSWTVFLTE